MGSQFLERHKRKSVLAALLLIFSGNTKYVVMLLLLVATSMPFVVSRDTLSRLLETPAIAAMMRHLGLGSVLSSINPKYSGDMLKSAMDRALADREKDSYWNRLLQSVGGGSGGRGAGAGAGGKGGGSGLDMITGGDILTADAAGKGKDGKGRKGGRDGESPGGSGGYGEGYGDGDTVYLDGSGGYGPGGYGRGGAGGAGGPGGLGGGFGSGGFGASGFGSGAYGGGSGGGSLYGNLMGEGLGGRYGGGSGGGYGGYGSGGSLTMPYIGKNNTGSGGAAGKGGGRYNSAMGQSGSKIPVPGSPQKVNAKSLGRVSGFTWRNVGYTVAGAKMNIRLGQEASIYRLADTHALTTSAAHFTTSAPEYRASYTGATYDGNPVNLDLVQTVQDPPVVNPDTNYIDNQTTDVTDIQESADQCTEAQSTHGTAASDAMTALTVKLQDMNSRRPDCDQKGAVNAWNQEVGSGSPDSLLGLCNKYNTETRLLNANCQQATDNGVISCAMYTSYTTSGGMKIKYCPRPGCKCSWKNPFCCLLWMIFWILFIAVMIAIAIIFGPLIAALAAIVTIFLLDMFFPDDGGVPAGLDQGPGQTDSTLMKTKFDGDGTTHK